jgi:HIRAN domain
MMANKPKAKTGKPKQNEILLDVVGINHRLTPPIQRVLAAHLPVPLFIQRERRNLHDSNALRVNIDPHSKISHAGMQIGYLRREVAAEWAPEIDAGRFQIETATLVELEPGVGVGRVKIGYRKLA